MRTAVSLVIAAVCALLGFKSAYGASERAKVTRELAAALARLEMEIGYGADVLANAVGRCATRRTRAFLDSFAEMLRGGKSPDLAWEECDNLLDIDVALKQQLRTFATGLGKSGVQAQCEHIRLAVRMLENASDEAERTARKQFRMRAGLGVIAGLSIVIITL